VARLARAIAPGIPHHVTQRGNRRQPTFFVASDYAAYHHLLTTACHATGIEI
jgi:putative transposase